MPKPPPDFDLPGALYTPAPPYNAVVTNNATSPKNDAQHWTYVEEKFLEIRGVRYRIRCYVHQESLREGFLCYAEVPPYRDSGHPLGGWHSINALPVPWEVAKEAIAEDAAKRITQKEVDEHKKREDFLASLRKINKHLFS